MKFIFLRYFFILLSFMPIIVSGQDKSSDYKILKAYYSAGDSTAYLTDWVEKGLNVRFAGMRDSMIISIDIGGRNRVFFLGMAVRMDNPGFITTSDTAEFYHWIFTSHIKEGIRNAYLMKEYIEGSYEKLGRRSYFIQIAFADESELQLYGYGVD